MFNKHAYVLCTTALQSSLLKLNVHNDQEGVRSAPGARAMVDKLQVPGLMTLGHQQAVVAELVDPEWRWKWEQIRMCMLILFTEFLGLDSYLDWGSL